MLGYESGEDIFGETRNRDRGIVIFVIMWTEGAAVKWPELKKAYQNCPYDILIHGTWEVGFTPIGTAEDWLSYVRKIPFGPPHPRGSCPPVTIFDGTPVQAYASWIVREIGRRVRIADDFPFHLTWAAIKKSGRVQNLFVEIQLQHGLPDQCRDWFFDRARKRWNARKRDLKLYYEKFSTHTEARNNVPLNLGIGAADWLKVTDVFRHANTVPGVDGKTKKELTQKARASQLAPTRMGSQSAKTYRSRYEKNFSKPCTPTIVLDRIYGVADPVSDEEVRDPMSEAAVEITKKKLPVVLVEAREQLDSRYKELLNDGSDESTAYSRATQQVFPDSVGRLDWSGTYANSNKGKGKVSASLYNDLASQQEILKKEVEDLKQILYRERMEAREREERAKEREERFIRALEAVQRGEGTSRGGGDGGSGGGGYGGSGGGSDGAYGGSGDGSGV